VWGPLEGCWAGWGCVEAGDILGRWRDVSRGRRGIRTISSLARGQCRGSWVVFCSYRPARRVSFCFYFFEPLFDAVLRLTQVHMGICRSRSLVSVSTVQCRVVLGPAVGCGVSDRTAIEGGKMGAELPL